MEPSIFTKIIRGEIPAHKVYEDEKTIVIIPLQPIAKGHVLVIPKVQVDEFLDLAAEDYQAVMATVQKVGRRMREVLRPRRVGLKIEGSDVPHVHVHVVAFDSPEQFHETADESQSPDETKNASLARQLAF